MSALGKCKVNDVLRVAYHRDDQPRLCRVIRVRDTDTEPLSIKSLCRRPRLKRGRFLVTCQDNLGQVRNFYSGAEKSAVRVGGLGKLLLWATGKLP